MLYNILICNCKSVDTSAKCIYASIQTSPNQYAKSVACECSNFYSGPNCQTAVDYCSLGGNLCDLYPGFNNTMTCQSLTPGNQLNLTYQCNGTCTNGFIKDQIGACQGKDQ